VLLKYVKEFSIRFRDVLQYVSVNDKGIIPVGEPGMPISSEVRGHSKSIVLLNGQGPVTLDHDLYAVQFHQFTSSWKFQNSLQIHFTMAKPFSSKITMLSSALCNSTELSMLSLVLIIRLQISLHVSVLVHTKVSKM